MRLHIIFYQPLSLGVTLRPLELVLRSDLSINPRTDLHVKEHASGQQIMYMNNMNNMNNNINMNNNNMNMNKKNMNMNNKNMNNMNMNNGIYYTITMNMTQLLAHFKHVMFWFVLCSLLILS